MNTLNIRLTIIAAAVLLVCAPLLHAVQLDGNMFNAGSERVGAQNPGNQRQISSGGVIVTWSESNDELRGFSHKTGDWEIIRIAPQKEIVPTVFLNMAAVRFGDSIAAFSGTKGWWDVIELSKDSKSQPTVSDSLVQIEDNGHLYTFAAEKASWTSPTDATLLPAEESMTLEFQSSSKAEYDSKVSRLVIEFRKWSDSLPRYKKHGMMFKARASGQQGAIVLGTARQSWMPELKAKVE